MKTLNASSLALCAGLGLSFPALAADKMDGMKAMGHGAMAAPAATDAQLAEGLVKKVDKATGKVTLTHGPLSNGMPGMTMAFKVKDAAWLEQMKAGQTIRFALDGAMTVVRFEAVK